MIIPEGYKCITFRKASPIFFTFDNVWLHSLSPHDFVRIKEKETKTAMTYYVSPKDYEEYARRYVSRDTNYFKRGRTPRWDSLCTTWKQANVPFRIVGDSDCRYDDVKKWIYNNIDDANHNTRWSRFRKGSNGYTFAVKFRKEQDFLLFKLRWS